MTIYRVENPIDTCGPYLSHRLYGSTEGDIIEMMYDEHENPDTHPTKFIDHRSVEVIIRSCQCAFDSFDKLISWFDKWIDYLLDIGFNIIQAEVPDNEIYPSISGKQIFFKRDNMVITNILF